MDYRDLMNHAPEGTHVTVITRESRLEDYAKKIGKKVEDLTIEDRNNEAEQYDAACWTPYDLMTS